MNCAARLVCKALGHEPADLHWLPRERRIEYKIATVCYSVITRAAGLTSLNCGSALAAKRTQNRIQDCYNLLQRDNLRCRPDLLELYTPSRTHRSSADDRIFGIPKGHKLQGQHAFSSTVCCLLLRCLIVTRLVPRESGTVSAHVLCTPYSHASVYSITSFAATYVGCMCVLAVTCHLHFGQNDRDLVRAFAVTRERITTGESAQKVDLGKENPSAAPAGTRTRDLSITSPALQPLTDIPAITLFIHSLLNNDNNNNTERYSVTERGTALQLESSH